MSESRIQGQDPARLGQVGSKLRLVGLGLSRAPTVSEEVLNPTSRQTEGNKWNMGQGQQELYGALAQGLKGLQKSLRESEEVQRTRTTRYLQLLAQEIRDRWVCQAGRPRGCGREGRPRWEK